MLINNPKHLLGSEPGTGKTPIAAYYTQYRVDYHGEAVAWVQPKSLMEKNRNEILRFTGFDPKEVVVLKGTPAERKQLMASGAKVFLTTFTGWTKEWRALVEANPRLKTLIMDEFHLGYTGGDKESKRVEQLYLSTRVMNSFVPMTGTVIKGRLNSCYPILHTIAPQFYGSYRGFVVQHAIRDEFGTIVGWRNHEKLKNVLRAVGTFRSFEEVYGKEAKVIEIEKVEMSDKHRDLYLELEATALIELEDSFIDAGNPAVAAMRARQIMQHPEVFEKDVGELGKDERLWVHIEDAINSGEQMVIFSSLVPEVERIVKALQDRGLTVGKIHGGVSEARRIAVDEAFREGKLQFIVATAATAGVGFNWGQVNTVVFLSLDYEDSSFIQAYRRGIRGKRTRPLRIIVMEYENSIDQRIFEIVQRKSRDASMVDETKEEILLVGGCK